MYKHKLSFNKPVFKHNFAFLVNLKHYCADKQYSSIICIAFQIEYFTLRLSNWTKKFLSDFLNL